MYLSYEKESRYKKGQGDWRVLALVCRWTGEARLIIALKLGNNLPFLQ